MTMQLEHSLFKGWGMKNMDSNEVDCTGKNGQITALRLTGAFLMFHLYWLSPTFEFKQVREKSEGFLFFEHD